MKEAKHVLLTFDYEPFLGKKSGTADKCIIEPTNALRAVLNRYKAKAVFFVDVLFLKNLALHPALQNDHAKVVSQLVTLYKEGHSVFPHIHPHWLDAAYIKEKNQFDLGNLSRYSLAKFPETDVRIMFSEAVSLLREIGIDYDEWGYRAGGWCIQPFSLFKNAFAENSIGFEFSVLPGHKNESENQRFDFTTVTSETPYYFSNAVETPDEAGSFLEFPISTVSFTSFTELKDKLIRKYLWKTGDRGWGDGLSAHTAALKTNAHKKEMISIDVLNSSKLNSYKKFLDDHKYMHWISHPKMFTKHGLKTFDRFLHYADQKFSLEFDFKKQSPKNN
ncbi:MAG: hypothetical protein M3R17_12200 [Bacteroidota bacterium]|nr:hypothetical protein [Bacteroidota bacterium]